MIADLLKQERRKGRETKRRRSKEKKMELMGKRINLQIDK